MVEHRTAAVGEECDECEGTGWTNEGWDNANKASGYNGPHDPLKGDCIVCQGTGVVIVNFEAMD